MRVFTSITPSCVSVSAEDPSGLPGGTAEASFMLDDGTWYLNRVIIRDAKMRGKGLGGFLVGMLKAALNAPSIPPCKRLVVEPGGYGSDPTRLDAFYKRHGFVEHPDGYLYWDRK